MPKLQLQNSLLGAEMMWWGMWAFWWYQLKSAFLSRYYLELQYPPPPPWPPIPLIRPLIVSIEEVIAPETKSEPASIEDGEPRFPLLLSLLKKLQPRLLRQLFGPLFNKVVRWQRLFSILHCCTLCMHHLRVAVKNHIPWKTNVPVLCKENASCVFSQDRAELSATYHFDTYLNKSMTVKQWKWWMMVWDCQEVSSPWSFVGPSFRIVAKFAAKPKWWYS